MRELIVAMFLSEDEDWMRHTYLRPRWSKISPGQLCKAELMDLSGGFYGIIARPPFNYGLEANERPMFYVSEQLGFTLWWIDTPPSFVYNGV